VTKWYSGNIPDCQRSFQFKLRTRRL